jgi:hypothetical protein
VIHKLASQSPETIPATTAVMPRNRIPRVRILKIEGAAACGQILPLRVESWVEEAFSRSWGVGVCWSWVRGGVWHVWHVWER